MNPLGGGIIPQHPDRFSFIRQNTEEPIAVSALKFFWLNLKLQLP